MERQVLSGERGRGREDDSLALDLGRITQSLFLCLLNEIVEQILESWCEN